MKINFAGLKKVFTFAIPNGNRVTPVRQRDAAGTVERGKTKAVSGFVTRYGTSAEA
ncbi:hypothetical protein [Parapedobacter sp. 10938]|uniref:hypothetical protein n=1 Tax=Parapedobacter flavus TaxID=3110225 RepID=UPI002DB5DF95|nr:hypothetical protein [Parapedobacter sp. 10938]MEC3882060.1 hypothetical protein [Parapedobacter sp. 10938]